MKNELWNQLIEAAKKNKKGFKKLKEAVVCLQQFELSAELRDIEKECFPETEESKNAKQTAKELNTAFRMVGLTVPEPTCYLISETIKAFSEKKGEFSLEDAVEIEINTKEMFIEL